MMRLLWLVCLILSLTCCGFALRGNYSFTQSISDIQLDTRKTGNEIKNVLVRGLKNTGLQVHVNIEEASFQESKKKERLSLLSERFDRQPLAYDTKGNIREYALSYSIQYQFSDQSIKTFVTQRSYLYDRLDVLASQAQEATLKKDILNDAVQHILRSLAAKYRKILSAEQSLPR